MRRMHVLAGMAIILLAFAAAAWIVISPGWAVGFVQAKVNEALGRNLKVSGGANLQLAPALAIRFDGVSLAGPSGMDGDFISAPSLLVPITVSGLIAHRLDVAAITFTEPQIDFTIDEIGRMSWPAASVTGGAGIKFYLNNAVIRFRDHRTEQSFALSTANLAVEQSPAGEITLEGTAIINGQLAKIQAYVKDVARASGQGSPAELAVQAAPLSVSFNGRLATSAGLGLAGTVTVSGEDLRQALRWTGAKVGGALGLKAFKLTGSLDATGRAFGMLGADIMIDDIAARGDVTLDFRGGVPKLQALAAVEAIDLDKYIAPAGGIPGEWGTSALGFAALRGLDGGLTIETRNLKYSGADFGPAKIAAQLHSGRLEARIVSGSSMDASVTLDGSGPTDGFALSYTGRDGDAARWFGPLAGIAWLGGNGVFSANVSGTGKTQQEIIATLKGEAHLALANGALHGLDIGTALAAVSAEMQDGWPAGGKGDTPFATLTADLTIADGIAAIGNLKLESPALTMTGTGDIDLLRRALDLRADPRLVTGAAAEPVGLPVAVVIKGPWARPRIYPDMADIVANPKAAYDALKALGFPQAFDSAGGN